MEKKIIGTFGNRLRVRVCGILIENDEILMVRHSSLGPKGILWAPPGGGMKFGVSAEENLKREFLEETGLSVEVIRHLFTHEFLQPPLHAIELFFEIKRLGGDLITGMDPEMHIKDQIIQQVKFISFDFINDLDQEELHNAIQGCKSIEQLLNRKGYIKFEKRD